MRGWDSVTVPGCVSAWVELHAKFGKLPFEKLFEPAIEYGRKGFLVSPTIAGQWAAQVAELEGATRLRRRVPAGRPPSAARASCSRSRRTRRRWRRSRRPKGKAFYRGELAEKMDAHAKKHGGAMRASRSGGAQVRLGDSRLEMDYRGYTLHEIPPNGQGIVALMALGMLRALRPALACRSIRADSLHLQIEAMKLAFADALRVRGGHRLHEALRAEQLLEQGLSEGAARS